MEQPEGRTEKIKLGDHEYTVVAQRHAYLERKLGPSIAQSLQETSNTADLTGVLSAGSIGYYGLLKVFIPDLMPLWEWRGFPSEKAFEETQLWEKSKGAEGSDQYDEKADKSPDYDQMVTAMQAVARVNRIDLIGKLKELVGPDFFERDLFRALRARVEIEGVRLLTNLPELTPGDTASESSPQPNGASDPTSGGTSSPTSA